MIAPPDQHKHFSPFGRGTGLAAGPVASVTGRGTAAQPNVRNHSELRLGLEAVLADGRARVRERNRAPASVRGRRGSPSGPYRSSRAGSSAAAVGKPDESKAKVALWAPTQKADPRSSTAVGAKGVGPANRVTGTRDPHAVARHAVALPADVAEGVELMQDSGLI